MMPNVIIFTTGSSGSSVLAGLISRQGYWLGDETKKLQFDTYENSELVDLNMDILKMSGFKRRDCNDIPPPDIERIKSLIKSVDLNLFRRFLEKCEKHQPWLWKDPRLAFTIHFWAQVYDFAYTKIIFIRRDPRQSYAGLILSRKVPISYAEYATINYNYEKSFRAFIRSRGINDVLTLTFEDLLLQPRSTLCKINSYLGLEVTIEDLRRLYKGKLGQLRYSYADYLNARLKYLVYKYVLRDYVRFPRGLE